MEHCVNCGRRIASNLEPKLCPRCEACTTLYDAIVVRLKRQIFKALRMLCVYLTIGLILYLVRPFSGAKTAGIVVMYFGGANAVLTIGQCLSQFIQLRNQKKEEQQHTV